MSNWMDEAPCKAVSPEVFFPTMSPAWGAKRFVDHPHVIAKLAPARAICEGCPHRDAECLQEALAQAHHAHLHEMSIVAGRTPRELATLRGDKEHTRSPRGPRPDLVRTVSVYNRMIENGSAQPLVDTADFMGISRELVRNRMTAARKRTDLHVLDRPQSFAVKPGSG